MRYVDVILPLPLDGTFTYSIPEGMEREGGAQHACACSVGQEQEVYRDGC